MLFHDLLAGHVAAIVHQIVEAGCPSLRSQHLLSNAVMGSWFGVKNALLRSSQDLGLGRDETDLLQTDASCMGCNRM